MRQISIWKNANFLLFFGGQLVSRLGDGVFSLGLVWYVHVLTNSTFLMSCTLAAGFIPRIVIGPVAGVFVDRLNKRHVLILTDLVRLILVGTLTVLTMRHLVTAALLIAFSLVLATASTLFAPAYYVLQKHIVTGDEATKAYSWQQVSTNVAQIAGPALAGVIIGSMGLAAGFGLDAATFLVSMIAFVSIKTTEPDIVKSELSVGTVLSEMQDGVKALTDVPEVRILTPFMLVFNFLVAAFENLLIVQFLANTLHQGPFVVGVVTACSAVGELVSGTVLGIVNTKWTHARGLLLNMIVAALSLAAIGMSQSVWLVGAFMFITGFCMSIVNIAFFSGIQEAIPLDALGRVWALLGALFDGTTPLSQLIFGTLATMFSAGGMITTSGLAAALAGVGALLHPALRNNRYKDVKSTDISSSEENVQTESS